MDRSVMAWRAGATDMAGAPVAAEPVVDPVALSRLTRLAGTERAPRQGRHVRTRPRRARSRSLARPVSLRQPSPSFAPSSVGSLTLAGTPTHVGAANTL
jgi:hypothetical protein